MIVCPDNSVCEQQVDPRSRLDPQASGKLATFRVSLRWHNWALALDAMSLRAELGL